MRDINTNMRTCLSNILSELGLLDWLSIYVGRQLGLVSRTDLAEYAIDIMRVNPNCPLEVILVASADPDLSEQEIDGYLKKLGDVSAASNENIQDAKDKWRLALLLNMRHADKTPEEKFAELQRIYADFDYPSDMEKCSEYYVPREEVGQKLSVGHRSVHDPYGSVLDVISLLMAKFAIQHKREVT